MARFGPYAVELSNEDKVFFADAGLTKGDLIAYDRDVAATLLPHLADRPLALQRVPDGIGEEGFFRQDRPDDFPDWIDDFATQRRSDGDPQGWTIANMARRLGQKEDAWAGIDRAATSIDGTRGKLDKLLDDED